MTKTTINTDTGDAIVLGADDSILTVTATGGIGTVAGSRSLQMVTVNGDDCKVTINGNVIDHTFASSITTAIDGVGAGLTVDIGKSGFLGADVGVEAHGENASITNAGRIDGPETGIELDGDDGNIVNSGIITGLDGVSMEGNAGKLVNEAGGRITGYGYGLDISGTASIVNHGYIGGQVELWGKVHLASDGTIAGQIMIEGEGCVIDLRGGTYRASGGVVDGGFGNDTLITDNANYTLSEQPNQGINTIKSSVSYVLPDNIQWLFLIGKKDINGTGSDGSESLYGNSGDNVLKGGGGSDNLAGLGGTDKLWGQGGNDNFYFSHGDGHDTIMDFDPSNEYVFLTGFKHFTTNDQVHSHFEKHGNDTWIDFGGGDVLAFHGLSKADLADITFQFNG